MARPLDFDLGAYWTIDGHFILNDQSDDCAPFVTIGFQNEAATSEDKSEWVAVALEAMRLIDPDTRD